MSLAEVLGMLTAMVAIAGLVGYYVYDTLNTAFKADKSEKHHHGMALSGRMSDMEKAQSKVFLSIGQELKDFSTKLSAISESNGQMMKTMLDAEEKYNEQQNDELFSLKSTLESLGETVKDLQKQLSKRKRKKTAKKSGKRK